MKQLINEIHMHRCSKCDNFFQVEEDQENCPRCGMSADVESTPRHVAKHKFVGIKNESVKEAVNDIDGLEYTEIPKECDGISGSIAAAFRIKKRDNKLWVPTKRLGELKELMADLKKDLSESHSHKKCMQCNKPPTKDVLWANGRAHAWFCDKCFADWKTKDGKGDICGVKVVKDGVAAKRYADNKNPSLEEGDIF